MRFHSDHCSGFQSSFGVSYAFFPTNDFVSRNDLARTGPTSFHSLPLNDCHVALPRKSSGKSEIQVGVDGGGAPLSLIRFVFVRVVYTIPQWPS